MDRREMKDISDKSMAENTSQLSAKLMSGLFWILLANLVVKPVWILGVEVGVQNAVGHETYGFYAAILNLAYIFNILLDLGITNFNTRNIAQHPQLVGKHLGGILGIKLCLLALYLVVTFGVGALMGYGSDEFHLLAWLTLAQFLNSLILYLRSNLEGLLLFRWDSLFSVLDRLLMIVICGMLLWGPRLSLFSFHFTVFHFVYAQVAAYAVTAVLAFVVVARKASFRRLRWDWPFFLVILRKSAPFALLVLLMASYNRIDPILLRQLSGDAEAGVYAGAFRLLDALTMVAWLVSVPLLPVFSKQLAADSRHTADSRPALASTLRIVFWPMTLFSCGAATLCACFATPLMELLYPGHGTLYAPAFRVVIFGIIPLGFTYIFGTLLTAGGRMRQLNTFAAITLALNVTVNMLLIPRLGAVGSAWASLTAQSFMAVAQLALAARLYRLPAEAFRLPRPADLSHLPQMLNKKDKKG